MEICKIWIILCYFGLMRFNLIFAGFFFLCSLGLQGQGLDTLVTMLEPMPQDESRVDLLNSIVTKMRERNVYEASRYGMEAKSLAEKLDYQKGLGLALENLGWIYYRRGIYSNAFELSQRALKITEELNDSIAIARCLNNVGAISYEKAQFQEAIDRFKTAHIISSRLGDTETSVRSLNNVAFSFLGLKNTDSAQFYAYYALESSRDNRQGYLPAFTYRILGDVAYEQGNMDLAMRHFTESMRISEETNNYFIQTSTMHRIGKVYTKQKKYGQAIEILMRNVEMAKKNGYADELERTYKLISDINYARNNVGLALEYLMRHLAVHDSLINQRNSEQLALLSAQFESELKQSQIELLTQNAKIKEEEFERQKAWTSFYVGCFVLGITIAVILFYSNRKIKKVNQELEHKTIKVGQQAAQLGSINKTKDKLLSIISHDIRSPLSSLRGMLNIAQSGNVSKEEFGSLTSRISNQLDSVYEDLGNLLQWTQSQLQGLNVNPESFELRSIISEVLELYKNAAETKKIKLKNEITTQLQVVADPNHVRLILRNLISNAIKFSREHGSIVVENSSCENFIKVSIRDSGIGLSQDEIPKLFDSTSHFSKSGTASEKGMGVGLLLTKEFVDKNGGTVSVESEPGKGSTFSFTLRRAV